MRRNNSTLAWYHTQTHISISVCLQFWIQVLKIAAYKPALYIKFRRRCIEKSIIITVNISINTLICRKPWSSMTCQLKAFVNWLLPLWAVNSCIPRSILQTFSRAIRSWQPWECCISFLEEFVSGYSGGGPVKSATTLAPRLYVPWGRSDLPMQWDCVQVTCSVKTSQCCYNTKHRTWVFAV